MEEYSQKMKSLDDAVDIGRGERDSSRNSYEDSLDKYFKEIQKCSLLTREEEISLAKKIEKGDKNAKQRFVESNLGLVIHMAKRYQNRGLPLADLIQEGNIGLITAINKYDYRKGSKFSTYATWCIRQTIGKAVAKYGKTVRVPRHALASTHKIVEVGNELRTKLGREPTFTEITSKTSMSVEKINDVLLHDRWQVSLDQPIKEEEDRTLLDILKDKIYSPEENYQKEETIHNNIKLIKQGLRSLKPIEADVLRKRFGLSNPKNGGYWKEHTLEEIGKKYNLSRERIRQIEETAINKIRKREGLPPLPKKGKHCKKRIAQK